MIRPARRYRPAWQSSLATPSAYLPLRRCTYNPTAVRTASPTRPHASLFTTP